MPEGTEVIEPIVTPPAEPVIPPVEPVKEPPEPKAPLGDEEPGGDSPEAVFARKQYREAKQAKAEAQTEREQRIRLEEQLRAAKETGEKPPRLWTPLELRAAIQAGTLNREEGFDYLADTFEQQVDRVLQEKVKAAEQLKPLERAKVEFDEYLKLSPDLLDATSDIRQKADTEVERLIGDYGQPRNVVTKRQALENVLGKLSDVKARRQMDAATRASGRPAPADAGAGGGTSGNNGKVDISKAPAHLVSFWDKTGTSEADRIKEMGYWQKNQGRERGQVRK